MTKIKIYLPDTNGNLTDAKGHPTGREVEAEAKTSKPRMLSGVVNAAGKLISSENEYHIEVKYFDPDTRAEKKVNVIAKNRERIDNSNGSFETSHWQITDEHRDKSPIFIGSMPLLDIAYEEYQRQAQEVLRKEQQEAEEREKENAAIKQRASKQTRPDFLRDVPNNNPIVVIQEKESGKIYVAELTSNPGNSVRGTPVKDPATNTNYVIEKRGSSSAEPNVRILESNSMFSGKAFQHLFEIKDEGQKDALLIKAGIIPLVMENNRISEVVPTYSVAGKPVNLGPLISQRGFIDMNWDLAHGLEPFPHLAGKDAEEQEKIAKIRLDIADMQRTRAALQVPPGSYAHLWEKVKKTPSAALLAIRRQVQKDAELEATRTRAFTPPSGFLPDEVVATMQANRSATLEPMAVLAAFDQHTGIGSRMAQPEMEQPAMLAGGPPATAPGAASGRASGGPASYQITPPIPMDPQDQSRGSDSLHPGKSSGPSVVDQYLADNLGTLNSSSKLERDDSIAMSNLGLRQRGVANAYGDAERYDARKNLAAAESYIGTVQRNGAKVQAILQELAAQRVEDIAKEGKEIADERFKVALETAKNKNRNGGALLIGTTGYGDVVNSSAKVQVMKQEQQLAAFEKAKNDSARIAQNDFAKGDRKHVNHGKRMGARFNNISKRVNEMKMEITAAKANIGDWQEASTAPTSAPPTPAAPAAPGRPRNGAMSGV